MEINSSAMSEDVQDEIAALVRQLQTTQQRLQELAGGEVDAVTLPGGQSYLLHEAQEKLRHNEESLRVSETRYRSLLTATMQIVWTADAEGRISGPLPEWQKFTGQSEQEVQGIGWTQALHPDDAERTIQAWTEASQNRKIYNVAYRLRRHDGVYRDFVVRGVPVFFADGSIVEWVGCCRDETERKQAEEALREKNALLRIAGTITRTGGWAIEMPDQRVFWSDEVFDLLEFPRGTTPPLAEALELYPQPWRDKIVTALDGCTRDGTPFDLEVEILTANGRKMWACVSGKAERRADGSVIRLHGAFQDVTGRKNAEIALRESEDRFRALTDTIPELIWTARPDGAVDYFNRRMLDFFGRPLEDVVEWGWTEIIHPDDLARCRDSWSRSLASGNPYEIEFRVLGAVEGYCWHLVKASPMRDSSGHIIRWFGSSTDIMEHKKAEAVLRESEDRFRISSEQLAKVLDSSLDAICTVDGEGHFTQMSAACERIWGYRADELIGRPFLDFVHPEDLLKTSQIAAEIMAGKPTLDFENRYLRKDGSITHIMWSSRWSESDQSLFAVARDHTETHQKETEALELAERLKLAVKASKVGIWDWDVAKGTMNWDEQMYELYGTSSHDGLAGVELWQRQLHPADQEWVNGELAEALSPDGKPFDASFRIVVPPQGEVRHIRGQGIVFRDAAGQAIHMLGTNWDDTKQVQREEVLNEKLENEKALRQQAAAGEQAKSEFLAVMSHEIRTPMNGILGFTEMLTQDAELSRESRGYVETIRDSGEALLHILDDVLDFSRIEEGRLVIEKVVISPSELIASIVALFSPQIREKGLEFQHSVAEDVPARILGDPGRMRQVLVNLMGNALKFTEKGAILIGVQRRDRRLAFFVQDSGSGIPTDKIEKIFQVFTQADSSISRRHGGTGLGLTISQRLAGLMGGELEVRSKPGEGSEFSLLIPLESTEASGPVVETPVAKAATALPLALRVLIVEDDKVNLKLMIIMLRKLGYTPLMAGNGTEAVRIYEEERPDCILMDVQMPEMDGIEATRKIRELEQAAGTPRTFIAALTADILPEHRARCYEAGMDFYLNKPVTRRAVADVLAEAARFRAQGNAK